VVNTPDLRPTIEFLADKDQLKDMMGTTSNFGESLRSPKNQFKESIRFGESTRFGETIRLDTNDRLRSGGKGLKLV